MSIGSVIKNVASGAGHVVGGVGKAVLGPSGVGLLPGPAPAAQAPVPIAQSPAPKQFQLPELDPNDPDYEEKKAIHDAYTELNGILASDAEAAGIDLNAKGEQLAQYAASQPTPKQWSPFSAFAIGMGNPEALNKVSADNARAQEEIQKREDYILQIKQKALQGSIADALEKGQHSKALAEAEKLKELGATQDRIKAERDSRLKLAEIEAQNKGKENVARIKASGALASVQARVSQLVDHYKLNAEMRKAMLSFASHYLGGLTAQKDAAGEPYYTQDDLDKMMNTLLGMAEDHSPLFETPPAAAAPAGKKAAAPKAETPEERQKRIDAAF